MKKGYSVTSLNKDLGNEDSLDIGVKFFQENEREKAQEYFNNLVKSAKTDYNDWEFKQNENGYEWYKDNKVYKIEMKEINISDEEMKRVEEVAKKVEEKMARGDYNN